MDTVSTLGIWFCSFISTLYNELFLHPVDGVNPSIACVTAGGKIFLHQAKNSTFAAAARPQQDAVSKKVRYLSINNAITAIGVAKRAIEGKTDALQGSASAHLFAVPSEVQDSRAKDSPSEVAGSLPSNAGSPGAVDRDVLLIGTDSNLQVWK